MKEIKKVSAQKRKEGRLPCPWCKRELCFYRLTGQRVNEEAFSDVLFHQLSE
jgi:hypothetical protein